jgi:hypothetical protein
MKCLIFCCIYFHVCLHIFSLDFSRQRKMVLRKTGSSDALSTENGWM